MLRRRAEIVVLLLCLLSGPTSSTNMGIRRRWRALEGYYNFDEDGDGDGSEGNPVDIPSTDDVDGIDVDAKDSKAHTPSVSSPADSLNESYGGGGKDKSTAGGRDSNNGGGSDLYSNEASGSYSGASDAYSSGNGSGSYSSGKGTGSYSGASDSYSGSSGSYSGASSSYSGASGSYSGASGSYSSGKGASSYSGGDVGSYKSPSKLSRDFDAIMSKVNVDVPLVPAIIVASIVMCCGMLCTAFMYQARPESTFTNCCRLSVHCIRSVCAIALNLYHCRLGDIPPIVCAMEDADDLDDEELERMKPRPGIQKALHIEHQKALSRVEFGSDSANKTGQPLMAKVFG